MYRAVHDNHIGKLIEQFVYRFGKEDKWHALTTIEKEEIQNVPVIKT